MKQNMEKEIVEFKDTINPKNIKVLMSTIIAKVQLQNMQNILVSLKLCKYKDSSEISMLVHEIYKIAQKMKISIDFIDYSEELFVDLKNIVLDTDVKLYKNRDVAALFIKVGAFEEDTKVLVFDENEENSKKIYFNLCKYGYIIERAQTMKEFLSGINSDSYDIVVTRTFLNKTEKKIVNKNKLTLSKKVIVNLPVFMNKAAETLVSFTGLEAEKVSHSIQKFDSSIDTNCIVSVMPFKGDLEGFFTLVFPRNIAITALESLLGEKVKENDTATLTDGVGEFCNIITGAAKTEFDSKNIKVVFDLPKTHDSLNNVEKQIGNNNGVWMNMELSGKPFYMFITK